MGEHIFLKCRDALPVLHAPGAKSPADLMEA